MRKLSFILFFSIVAIVTQAQTNLDSLYTVWQDKTQVDSNRVNAYGEYIWKGFVFSQPDSAFSLAEALVDYGTDNKYPEATFKAYHLQGISFHIQDDYSKALYYWQQCLSISKQLGDQQKIAKTLGSIGMIYRDQGDYSKSLDYITQGLEISRQLGDQEGIASSLANIGRSYSEQGDNTNALDYYTQGIEIHRQLGNQRAIASSLGNIGIIYDDLGNYPKALDYYQQCLSISKQLGDQQSISSTLNNIGVIYNSQGDDAKALDYFNQSLIIRKQIGDKLGIAYSQFNIGAIYGEQGDYTKALDYCQKGYELALLTEALPMQKQGCQCLYDTYKAIGKGNEALEYLEKIQMINDSINTQETTKKLQQMEFTKQVLADSLKQEEVKLKVEMAHQQEVAKKDKTRNMLIGGALLLLLIAIGFYMRWRYVKKSRDTISKEKDRSNNLLLNILPADIAEELKIHGKAEARDFDMVSILFTDFKGFTAASAKLSAADLVNEINTCFEAFDNIMDKYNIEKIKTIGDAYMAAGGLPVPSDDSIKKTILAAIEMQDFIGKRKADMDAAGKPAFQMRVGIHTGPVVAGIVGIKKFQYDIWGDTVNTAARMESSGDIEKVNISQATYDFLKDDSDFAFESRGKIEAKGKGEIDMYFVSLKTD